MARKRCVLRWGAAVGLYWAACAAHVWRTGGLLALGLAWNMLLALLPLCFACAAGRCRLWAGRAALAVLWLLFLPNTFYMLTDLIHTPQNMEWVNAADWTVRHSENVSDWLLTLLLGTGAVLAVLLGLEAMRVFRVYCCVHWPRPAVWAGGGTVLLLCGFGMYIGRFLRLNSWDILHPLALLRRVWASMDTFQLQVTLLFAGAVFLLWLAYGALRPVDGEKQENKEAFMKTIQQSEGKPICLRLERNGRQKEVKITPVLSNTAQTYQIGAWIRDSIQGIGTVTYYDAENGTFGALGHGVYDVDTDDLMVIHCGSVVDTTLTEIVKGEKGAAGELIGQVEMQEKLAVIEKNTETGIYGKAAAGVFAGESYPVATKAEVKKGAAVLLSDLEGKDVQAYAIEIESLEKNGGRQHKDMNIRIMDERLLALTGGIVQGMSGSPILQDGKLVGAVTHVTLADPTKGYGIFMENMAA